MSAPLRNCGQGPVICKCHPIGNGVYIGPNAVIQMGVTIGDRAIAGANSLVNGDVPPGVKAVGSPARIQKAERVTN
jgi:acetyltransferase-like isoleucine patch superfamily enzyme